MHLTDTAHRALLDWIDLSARLRKNAHAAQQTELLEQLRGLAGEHKANAERIAALEATRTAEAERAAALESDVAARSATIERMEARLASGEGLTSRDLVALQGDIASAKSARESVEEDQLTSLGTVEEQDAEIAGLRTEGAGIAARGRDLQLERKARAEELSAEAAELENERAGRAEELPDDLRQRVTAKESAGRVGAAVLTHGACGACGDELSGVARDAISGAEPGTVVECDSCETLLVAPLG